MEEKKFRTKTGYCHILPDKIILSRNGVIGDLADLVVKDNTTGILVLYGVIAAGLLFVAYTNYLSGQNITAIIFGGFGLLLINGIFKSLNFSGTPLIHRSNIQKVVFKKGAFGIFRSRFEVLFKNEDGKIRKRIIMLPGSSSADKHPEKKAMGIMVESGLMSDTA